MFYKTLFNINIHHAYFLDDGEAKFSSMSPPEKIEQLQRYRTSDYLKIIPTATTASVMRNYRMLLKPHKQGFRVLTTALEKEILTETKYSPIIDLDNDLTLTFAIHAKDIFFNNYTQITARDNNRLYLFSNIKPSTEAVGFGNIFTEDGKIDSSFLLTAESSRNLITTISGEDEFFNNETTLFSMIHKIEAINENTQLSPSEKENAIKEMLHQYIQCNKKNGLIGYVRLTAKGDSTHHLLEFDESDINDIKQYVLEPTPEFTLSFKNRRTHWRFIKLSDDITLTTENKKPLTKNGFVEIEASDFNPEPTEDFNYPNPTADSIKKENNNYYSEVFI